MVGAKRRREGSQKRAIRGLRDQDNFHRLSIGRCRVAEVLDGRRSQHEDRHALLARKLSLPWRKRFPSLESTIRTGFGEVTGGLNDAEKSIRLAVLLHYPRLLSGLSFIGSLVPAPATLNASC